LFHTTSFHCINKFAGCEQTSSSIDSIAEIKVASGAKEKPIEKLAFQDKFNILLETMLSGVAKRLRKFNRK
jgi:hypothetical protein